MARTYTELPDLLDAIADAIRAKTGGSAPIVADNFPAEIDAISTGISGVEKDVWSTGAAAPASINRSTSQLYNGKIYCPADGGNAMHIYDIASNSWITGAAAPYLIPMDRQTSQLYNGKIYCPQSGGTVMHIYTALAFTE